MERSGNFENLKNREQIKGTLIRKWVDGNRQRDNLINWMIPVEEFQYREISPETLLYNQERNSRIKTWRAGIIPVVKIGGEQHWLLGSFWENFSAGRILTDLGGKCKNQGNNKESPLSCALRETREETKGLLNPVIEKAIYNSQEKKGNYTIFEGYNKKRNQNIYFYFVFVDYEDVKDIPYQFSQIYELPIKDKNGKFQKGEERLGPLGFYKQSDILNRKERTARNLTDFVSYLNGYKF